LRSSCLKQHAPQNEWLRRVLVFSRAEVA
jgi:hypothetical protein